MLNALNYIIINSLNIKIFLWLHYLSCSHIFQSTTFLEVNIFIKNNDNILWGFIKQNAAQKWYRSSAELKKLLWEMYFLPLL